MLVACFVVRVAAGAEEHAEHHAPSITDLLWPVLNFGLFLAVLYRFAWPTVRVALADRRKHVQKELAAAADLERQARDAHEEVERLRAAETAERERILGELRDEAERERRTRLESARGSAQRMRDDARRLGEQEATRAVLAIRRFVAAEATRRAEQEIRRRLGDAEQREFVSDFVAGVGAGATR